MYVLHYAPDNASLILRLVLEETGLPYRCALVDRRQNQQQSRAYLALNPAGLIPVLETPDGPVSETAACLLWLADRHPETQIAPGPDSPARGAFLKWLFFLSNTAHADLRQIFYPEQYVPEEAVSGHHAIMTGRMQRHFRLMEAAMSDLFAPPGLLAPYAATLMRWSVLYPKGSARWFRAGNYPRLFAMAQALEARPATLAVAKAEGLGATPFTSPAYPNPPEGSAT